MNTDGERTFQALMLFLETLGGAVNLELKPLPFPGGITSLTVWAEPPVIEELRDRFNQFSRFNGVGLKQ